MHTHTYSTHTSIVSHSELGVATPLSIDMVASAQEDIGPIGESRVAGKMEWSVPIAIADQRVCVGLEQILDDLVLACEHSQVEWGL